MNKTKNVRGNRVRIGRGRQSFNGRNGAASKKRRFRSPKTRLEAAIARYADLFDFAPIAYVSFDRGGRVAEANVAATELLGTSRDFLIGRPFAAFVSDAAAFKRHLLRCRTLQQRVETELRLKPRGRGTIPTQLFSAPITSPDGKLLFQTGIVDLSAREDAERALREKEAELELIVTQTPFMLTRCTRDLRYRYVSNAY